MTPRPRTDHPNRPVGSGGASTSPDRTVPDDPTTDRPGGTDRDEPGLLRTGLTVVLWALSMIATWMAASGQLGFADWAAIKGPNRYGVPAILELSAVTLLLLGYRHGRRRRSPYPLWLLAGGVGAFAVYTNIVHAGHRAGMVYGAASAVALLLWAVKLRLDLTYYLVRMRHIPPARPKFGKLLLVAPRLAHRAWVVAVRRQVKTTDDAVTLAEVWMAVFRDFTDAGVEKKLAKRTAWRTVYEMSGGPLVDLPRAAEVATVAVTVRPASEEPTAPTVDGTDRPDRDDPATHPTTRPAGRANTRPQRHGGTRPQVDIRMVWSDTIRANAAMIRDRFRGRSDPTSIRQVRDEMGWSNDRAKPAFQAYRAGGDLEPERQESAS